MKQVTKFQAEDGRLFDDEAECLSHEEQVIAVKALIEMVHPKGIDIDNGKGYIQLTPETQQRLLNGYVALVDRHQPELSVKVRENPRGFIGRILGDSSSPLMHLYYTYCLIDKEGRLWDQPYFANNPERGTQVCVGVR
jgi:hypothetical protein